MNEKINEVRDYFKSKLLAGDFEIVKIGTHELELKIDGMYLFNIWIGNLDVPSSRNQYNGCYLRNFMELSLSEDECILIDIIVNQLVCERRRIADHEEKMKQFIQLKSELNIT